jgi:hypothetical protein
MSINTSSEIDPCVPDPCVKEHSYTCFKGACYCKPGFSGRTCETSELNNIRILQRLPVQTGISSSRVTVYDGNKPLWRPPVIGLFSCILQIIGISKRNHENLYSH